MPSNMILTGPNFESRLLALIEKIRAENEQLLEENHRLKKALMENGKGA